MIYDGGAVDVKYNTRGGYVHELSVLTVVIAINDIILKDLSPFTTGRAEKGFFLQERPFGGLIL